MESIMRKIYLLPLLVGISSLLTILIAVVLNGNGMSDDTAIIVVAGVASWALFTYLMTGSVRKHVREYYKKNYMSITKREAVYDVVVLFTVPFFLQIILVVLVIAVDVLTDHGIF